jgi:hypothetical protein
MKKIYTDDQANFFSTRAREGGRLMSNNPSTLRPHGGYRQLRSFQVTEIIYDGTVLFCDRFVDKRSRTHDQMVQAARSGRQKHRRGQPGLSDVKSDRAQAGKRRPR